MSEPAAWQVRPAEANDATRLADLPEALGGARRTSEAWHAWLADPATVTLMAQAADGRLTGLLDARRAADEAEIIDLWVAPSDRRKGIAAALLTTLRRDLASSAVERLFLEVAVDNAAARALYEKQGFATVARRGAYYARPGIDPVDALVMVRPIAPL